MLDVEVKDSFDVIWQLHSHEVHQPGVTKVNPDERDVRHGAEDAAPRHGLGLL